MKLEIDAASALIGVAAFEVWKAWQATAPSLSEVRSADPNDISIQQRLLDSNITVGGMAVIIGAAFLAVTRDWTPLVLMLFVFGALSFFHHWTFAAESR